MRTLCFFSGFDRAYGFTDNIIPYLQKSLQCRDRIVFIASSPENHEKSERYLKGNNSWLIKAGVAFHSRRLLDDRTDPDAASELIRTAGCIFLMGGDTLAQIGFLRRYGLSEAIRNSNAPVLGISAGAINMACTSLCTKDNYFPETVVYKGIGLADYTVEPHFDLHNAEQVTELKNLSKNLTIYAMCDNSAIIVQNGTPVFLGELYHFHQGTMRGI